jgi:hypothetical protein
LIGVRQVLNTVECKGTEFFDVCYLQEKVKSGKKFAREFERSFCAIAIRLNNSLCVIKLLDDYVKAWFGKTTETVG